jgi:hypothetical protein
MMMMTTTPTAAVVVVVVVVVVLLVNYLICYFSLDKNILIFDIYYKELVLTERYKSNKGDEMYKERRRECVVLG